MGSHRFAYTILTLAIASLGAAPAMAANECPVENASGAVKGPKVKKAVLMHPDTQSTTRFVNMGDDRESETIQLRVIVPAGLPKNLEKRMEVTVDPFVRTNEKTETVSFPDATFSKLAVSGNRKRISFKMCVDPPNDLPAGKYLTTVMLDGPRGMSTPTMTVTLNGKDGHGFILAAAATALLAFFVLLYKAASDKRATRLAEAKKKPANEQAAAIEKAENWPKAAWSCIVDWGWMVPTLASIAAAFGLLWAAYEGNPAWGEAGFVSSAIALIGAGLAAVGAKAIFTQSPPNP